MRVAGIMSGTSLDGVDVAIIDIQRRNPLRFTVAASLHRDYPVKVRQALLGVSNAVAHVGEVSRLNFLLGEIYADCFLACCRKGRVKPSSVSLIGCHGQTIYHEGQPQPFLDRKRGIVNTLQIGEAAVIAERTGVDVVTNFRERDIAAGGKGAPLVPLFDFLLFRHAKRGRIALNLGGIGNITAIPAGAALGDLVAFDTGPANMIIDQLVARMTGGRLRFDADGRIARTGQVNVELLARLLRDPYFRKKPPKTAGREQYGAEFVDSLIQTGLDYPDLIATATAFTSRSVALGIRQCQGRFEDLIAAGGGARNSCLMEMLAKDTGIRTRPASEFGVDSDLKEAVAFAVLAFESQAGRPGNVPSATGARRPAVLGKLTRAMCV